ncbi:MAG: Xaa-Pro peptidase family protein [Candidatus Nanopelagicales bacterium]
MSSLSPDDVDARIAAVALMAQERAIDAVLVTPGPDLRYLIGYDAVPLERLTCLVIRSDGQAHLVVPALESLAAAASPGAHLPRSAWGETDDPFLLTADIVGTCSRIAVNNQMWAEKSLRLAAVMPGVEQVLAGPLIDELRMRKSAVEVLALTRAGAAIDRVHQRVPEFLREGRTEREVGADIADAILAEGHVTVDFVIVASGPNAASPHHEVSDRVMMSGDAVVVDIGGSMPDGYRSDCTRTYHLGEPTEEFRQRYAVLQAAQAKAVEIVSPGITCEQVDAAARDILAAEGMGDLFIHRTGHGIGMETHEEPYIVAGNSRTLEPGMAFSVEPGFYAEGLHGARIEDIVVVTESGARALNTTTHDLVVIR